MAEAPVKVSTVRPTTPSTFKRHNKLDLLDIAEDLEVQRELWQLLDDSDYEKDNASKECKTNNQLFGVESDEDSDETKLCDSPVRQNEEGGERVQRCRSTTAQQNSPPVERYFKAQVRIGCVHC